MAAFSSRTCLIGFCTVLAMAGMKPSYANPGDPVITEALESQQKIFQTRGKEVPAGYVIDRALDTYTDALSDEFARSLNALGPDDRWLDIGAGEGKAILDYCTSTGTNDSTGRSKKARAVALSLEDRRSSKWYETAATLDADQIQYRFGKPLRDYSREELGQFQLITDVIGGFSYTDNLTAYIRTALGALTVNGRFFSLLADVHSEKGTNRPHYPGSPYLTEIRNADGSATKICTWLKSISCVQVTCEFKDSWVPAVEVYRIRKICEKVEVPVLETVHYLAGTPPERRFYLRDPLPKPPAVEAAKAE